MPCEGATSAEAEMREVIGAENDVELQHQCWNEPDNQIGAVRWPDPEPLEDAGVELPYPLDALPSIIGDAVAEYQSYGQQPVPMVACSGLASASLAAQPLADVVRDRNLSGPISLYTLVVAISGERKTSADRAFVKPIREWMLERREALQPDIAAASAAAAAWRAEQDGLLQKIKSTSGKKGIENDADMNALKNKLAALEQNKPHNPLLPRLFYEDVSPERLAVKLAEGWPSASLWSDEAGLVVGSHAMSDDSMMRYLALLNRLWDGGTFERDRQSGDVVIKGRRFTGCLLMQPIILTRLLNANKGASRGMGLIARCCLAWPRSTIGSRLYRPAVDGMPAMEKLHSRLREMLDKSLPTKGPDMELTPPALPLSSRAFTTWRDFHDDVEVALGRWGEFGNIPDIGAKIAENAVRIAAVFHVVENDPVGEIGEATMVSATRVAVWHLADAKRLIGKTEKSQTVLDAELLLEWAQTQPPTPISPRRILNAGPSPLREKQRRDSAINLLKDTGPMILNSDGKLLINPKSRRVQNERD
jgi:hypothetical protein